MGFTSSIVFASVAWIIVLAFSNFAVADVDPIVIKGSKFFYKSNGTEFFIKGVAYQQNYNGNGTSASDSYTDPLVDVNSCRRDIPLLQRLQTNTIRVYALDPTLDHSVCMGLLQDAGIYVIADLSEPKLSINRDTPQWTDALYARYVGVIDAMAKYNNVLGFFAGNEVANAPNNTQASSFVKAAVRDMKAYIKLRQYRQIGVGYATSDDANIRDGVAAFFNCGPEQDSVDFYGYNIYSWCNPSTYRESGFQDRTDEFRNYSVPVFFAEYGCNTPSPRSFDEVQTLYGDEMSPVWSGGIVYMYFQEDNNYGLVSVSGPSASPLPDFTALSSQIANVTPSAVKSASYRPTNTEARACPTVGSAWNASTSLPPSPNKELCTCMVANVTCRVNPGVSSQKVAALFDQVCGLDRAACDGIEADGSTGKYGALSMCNATEQLSWAFNSYYLRQGQNPQACDFGGNASRQATTTPAGRCPDLLSQVGTAGTGTVTSAPTGTGGSATPSKRPNAAAHSTVTGTTFAVLTGSWNGYTLMALLAGAACIFLETDFY
ncbi:MAG: 1,3-beta-glucanosyltransferase gas1 [Thelocarpon impressellum]|nr:MAG: 1,3-beta-glucanosyltransferase gas1 [Thelocarpon impressellum]